MRLAMVGLGRMGGNMVRRLLRHGHEIVAWDRSAETVTELAAEGAEGATGLADLVSRLETPRLVWLMVPAGAPVDQTIEQLLPELAKGDIIVDGGNSNFRDTIRRGAALRARGAFAESADLAGIRGYVEDSGEGRWTVQEAIDRSVPAPVITLSLLIRFASRQDESFSAKVIAALRNQFGGHAVKHA